MGERVFEVCCSPSDVARYIREFDFGNYALDEVDMVKDEEWVDDLALYIVGRLRNA